MRSLLKSTNFALRKYGIKSTTRNLFSYLISDVVIISFRKTGKTWLRLMLARMLQKQYGIKKIKLNTEYMTLFRALPNVMFSHAGTTVKNNKINFSKIFKRKRIVFLARDPRAQMISLFYDYTKRHRQLDENNISNFIRNKEVGIDSVIRSMNSWSKTIADNKNLLMIKYEDLYLDTEKELRKMLEFLRVEVKDDVIKEAVEFASAKNMRKLELKNSLNDPRMSPGNKEVVNSFKSRKCKLGSFQEELSKTDLDYINKKIREELDPIFDYQDYTYVEKLKEQKIILPFDQPFPEIEIAIKAVIEAGEVITSIQNKDHFKVEEKDDLSPVSEADLASNKILQKELSKTGHLVVSEESDDNLNRLNQSKVWIIDPIDGTKSFITKDDDYSVMVALVENNIPVLGIVYQPTFKLLYVAQEEQGAYVTTDLKAWTRLNVSPETNLSESSAVMSRHHLKKDDVSFMESLGVTNYLQKGSGGLKIGLICEGKTHLYFNSTDQQKQWDTAASYVIIKEAGGKITDLLGKELEYNVKELSHKKGILATNNTQHETIVERYKKFIEKKGLIHPFLSQGNIARNKS